jgi:hypothetical protein
MKIQDITVEEFVFLKRMFDKNLTAEVIDKILRIEGNRLLVAIDNVQSIYHKISEDVEYSTDANDQIVYFWRICLIDGAFDMSLEIAKIIDEKNFYRGHNETDNTIIQNLGLWTISRELLQGLSWH